MVTCLFGFYGDMSFGFLWWHISRVLFMMSFLLGFYDDISQELWWHVTWVMSSWWHVTWVFIHGDMNVGFVWLCGLVFRVTSLEMNCSVSSNDRCGIQSTFVIFDAKIVIKLKVCVAPSRNNWQLPCNIGILWIDQYIYHNLKILRISRVTTLELVTRVMAHSQRCLT